MKRYDAELDAFDNLRIIERPNGDWVNWDDVEKLESSHKELLDALKTFIEYNDQGGPMSFDTDAMWAAARNAITNAEGIE